VDEPLPETRAALYERFTRYFYEWKQEQHPTTRTERRQLNQALGELAKAGINSKARFRLGEDLACDVMGEPLFDLACRLGWLNLVDREAKSDEPVYAFFHPTFQEYFAACAIDDWHFFLNHVPHNPMQGTYRIFEPQWKQVILLWLGREGREDFRKQKEEFIEALIGFEDGYWSLPKVLRCPSRLRSNYALPKLLSSLAPDDHLAKGIRFSDRVLVVYK
jgi:predicted NACHT family NTPase